MFLLEVVGDYYRSRNVEWMFVGVEKWEIVMKICFGEIEFMYRGLIVKI